MIAIAKHDVRRFYIAMNNTVRVGVVERRRNFAQISDGTFWIELFLASKQLFEASSAHDTHRVIRNAFALTDGKDWNDVRMIEARGEPGLTLKSRKRIGRHEWIEREYLERDFSVQCFFARAEYHPHAAFPEHVEQFEPITNAGLNSLAQSRALLVVSAGSELRPARTAPRLERRNGRATLRTRRVHADWSGDGVTRWNASGIFWSGHGFAGQTGIAARR
jgi:hypothetical protein